MSNNKDTSWPAGIFGVYGIFVIGLIVAVFLSLNNDVEMVTSNYYEKTLTYEDQITRIKNTKALTQQPDIAFNQDKSVMILTMPEILEEKNYTGKIKFFRPSNSSMDKSLKLQCDAQGKQIIPLSTLVSGKWKVQLLWSDGQKEYYFEKVIII